MIADTFRTHRPSDDDAGLGLIEFIVAILVSTIVLVGVGTILISSWLHAAGCDQQTQATNRGQLISSAVERAMRNGIAFQVSGPKGASCACGRPCPVRSSARGSGSPTVRAQMVTAAGALPVDETIGPTGRQTSLSGRPAGSPIDFFTDPGAP